MIMIDDNAFLFLSLKRIDCLIWDDQNIRCFTPSPNISEVEVAVPDKFCDSSTIENVKKECASDTVICDADSSFVNSHNDPSRENNSAQEIQDYAEFFLNDATVQLFSLVNC